MRPESNDVLSTEKIKNVSMFFVLYTEKVYEIVTDKNFADTVLGFYYVY